MRRMLAFLLILLSPAASLWFVADSPIHVVLMHTNDLHGQLLPREGLGGIAEIATIIRSAKPDLIVDAGDISTGTFLADEFKGAPTIRAMNQIGYMVGTIGNHEFDYGQDALRQRLREAKFPVLSANLQTSISQIKKYAIVTAKGIRFGFIGLTTEDVKTQSHPKNVADVTVLDSVKTLQELLPEVRKKSDFIIVLAHVEDAEEKRIASAFPEIQLIIGGHNHQALGPFWLDKTLVVKTGSAGRRVGRVDLEFQAKKLSHIEGSLIPVTDVRPDPTIAKILRPFIDRVQSKMTEVIGDATDDLTSSRTAESTLANVLADAFREKTKTQIAIHNVGGIRTSIPKGKVTWGKAFEVLPFQNTLVTLKLTGAQLKTTLARGLAPTVGMVAVSGIRVQFNGNGSQTEPTVSALLSDGTAIDDSKLYSVTTNDFVLAGGDGFTEFGKGSEIHDTGIYLRDVLVEYFKAHHVISPKLDGRIVVQK